MNICCTAILANALVENRQIFVIMFDLVLIALVVILGMEIAKKLSNDYKEQNKDENKLSIKTMDYSSVEDDKRGYIWRKAIAPDGIDTGANGYLVVVDAGREIYIRMFTIAHMPNRTKFNHTFASLFDFPSCTSSVFIEPITNRDMSHKLDRQINSLEVEMINNAGNTNRQRKLHGQHRDVESWAEKVETGEEKFFNVQFLFGLSADSIEKLNTLSDDFRNLAIDRDIQISSLYGIQAEAFADNMPLNHKLNIYSKYIKSDGLPKHLMDRKSLSTVFNYTTSTYTHKNGIPLGRDLFTKKPFVFDVYDPSHLGFTLVIAGKTGSGKSATIKMMCERYHLQGYRFVAIDSQKRKGIGEGEYAALAEILGGVNFQISSSAQNILNPFEVHESLTYEKTDIAAGHNIRTLELREKIVLAKNDIRTMMQSSVMHDDTLNTYVDRVITDCLTDMYKDFGIVDRDPDSLYEMGHTVIDGQLTSGLIPKKLPTITDFYKNVLLSARDNTDEDMRSAYKMVIMGLKDYVRELYYSENYVKFFTRDEFEDLPSSKTKKNTSAWRNPRTGEYDNIVEVHGVKPYFDGQSTIQVSKQCPFTNIDISQLSDDERNVAREIGINFINEQFIKVNSESIEAADKLAAIFDEAHENFAFSYARKTLANAVRTARKMNVSIWFSTQTVEEFSRFDETKDILRQAAVKMISKQDPQDLDYLVKTLHLTPSQANLVCNSIGTSEDASEESRAKHSGEMCVIDNSKVIFIKVDMLKATEKLSVETTSEEIKKLYKVS